MNFVERTVLLGGLGEEVDDGEGELGGELPLLQTGVHVLLLAYLPVLPTNVTLHTDTA